MAITKLKAMKGIGMSKSFYNEHMTKLSFDSRRAVEYAYQLHVITPESPQRDAHWFVARNNAKKKRYVISKRRLCVVYIM